MSPIFKPNIFIFDEQLPLEKLVAQRLPLSKIGKG
jgi:hypothetical protein